MKKFLHVQIYDGEKVAERMRKSSSFEFFLHIVKIYQRWESEKKEKGANPVVLHQFLIEHEILKESKYRNNDVYSQNVTNTQWKNVDIQNS